MDITPERSKQVASPTRTTPTPPLVIAKKDAYKSFDDLKGKRIGWKTAPRTRNTCRTNILK
jgi:arginine transport system substrate-binding protein